MSKTSARFTTEQVETVRDRLTPKAYGRALQYAQGLSLEDIARQEGVGIDTVKFHVRWACQLIMHHPKYRDDFLDR